ncbi:MAG TPA: hypothetical protein VFU89_00310 [Rhabdochlamydiaceae bacterium]|nr:hypothetical protein [Rhabdochlamydiaceae bacterium]
MANVVTAKATQSLCPFNYSGIDASCLATQSKFGDVFCGEMAITLEKINLNTSLFISDLWTPIINSGLSQTPVDITALEDFFEKISLQGSDEAAKNGMLKEGGYISRLLEFNEPWETWLEHRTDLGKVASVFYDYVRAPFSTKARHLTSDTIIQASKEARDALNNPKANPSWKELGQATGGFLSVLSPTHTCLNTTLPTILDHILKRSAPRGSIDIAFAIDTAMQPDHFIQLKDALLQALDNLRDTSEKQSLTPRILFVVYAGDSARMMFPTSCPGDYTSDIENLAHTLVTDNKITPSIIDILSAIQKNDYFSQGDPTATRSVILVSSTLNTCPGKRSTKDVIGAYQKDGTAIYPIAFA